jgi:hypothetical protein
MDVGLPYVPVAQWETFFRPHLWGFFVDLDTGLSWVWCFQALALILSCYLFLTRVLGTQRWHATGISLFLYFNPFIQFWSLAGSLFISYGFLAMWAIDQLSQNHGFSRLRTLLTLSLGYLGISIALLFYPAYAIPVAWVLIAYSIPYVIQKPSLLLSLSIALGTAFTFLFIYYFQHQEVIDAFRNTSYPGARFVTGGNQSIIAFFSNLLYSVRHGHPQEAGANLCEAAHFYHFFPVLPALAWAKRRELSITHSRTLSAFLILSGFILSFNWWGLPRFLAQITGAFLVPESRTTLAWGLIVPILLGVVSKTTSNTPSSAQPREAWLVRSVAALFVIGSLYWTFLSSTKAELSAIIWLGIICCVTALMVFRSFKAQIFALLVIAIFGTAFFNPVSLRGTTHAIENSIIIKTNSQLKLCTDCIVVTKSNTLSNIPRMIPVRSVGGTTPYPNTFWISLLDPNKLYSQIWNRYATVIINEDQQPSSAPLQLLNADQYQVTNRYLRSRVNEKYKLTELIEPTELTEK